MPQRITFLTTAYQYDTLKTNNLNKIYMIINKILTQHISNILLKSDKLRSSDIHRKLVKLGLSTSLVTVKRKLSKMLEDQLIVRSGAGRYIFYSLSIKGRLLTELDYHTYSSIEPDLRYGQTLYNFKLFEKSNIDLFTKKEKTELNKATSHFLQKQKNLTPILVKKELERLVIELSWKSSKIEGNTYTLLDTEKLIRENIEAKGHPKSEATMILNHKSAFKYIWENKSAFNKITKKNIGEVHSLLTKDMDIPTGCRSGPVGVTGSIYQPLDNIHQIEDAMTTLIKLINNTTNPFQKALFTLTGISYIQPFFDGNKRTSRLYTNAVLLANGLAPLSYRSIDEENYRAAMLAFYELNTIIPIKRMFINQYISATELYSLKVL